MIPAVAGATLLDAREMLAAESSFDTATAAVSFVTAFIVAVVALKVLLGLLRKGRFSCFAYYLVPLGIATVLYGLLA